VNVEEPTVIPGLKDSQSTATQNMMGAKMQPCLTPEVVEILGDSLRLSLTHALVFS